MKLRTRRLLKIGTLTALAGLLACSAAQSGEETLVGKKAPELQGDFAVGGKTVQLADLKGKIVVLEFWAPASGPCRGMFTPLSDWQKKYGDKGLVVLGVTTYYKQFTFDKSGGQIVKLPAGSPLSSKEEQQMLQEFAGHYDLKYKIMALSQPDWDKACQDYGVKSIPTAVVIDAKGVVKMARTGVGSKNLKDLEAEIEKLVSEEK